MLRVGDAEDGTGTEEEGFMLEDADGWMVDEEEEPLVEEEDDGSTTEEADEDELLATEEVDEDELSTMDGDDERGQWSAFTLQPEARSVAVSFTPAHSHSMQSVLKLLQKS